MRKTTCNLLFLIISAVMLVSQGDFVSNLEHLSSTDYRLDEAVVLSENGQDHHESSNFHHSLAELLEIQEENKKDREKTFDLSGNLSHFSNNLYPSQFRLVGIALPGIAPEQTVDVQSWFCTYII